MNTQTDPGHGNSPAAWTAVTIMLIAFTVGTVAFFFDMPWIVVGSAVLVVVGLLVGWVLSKMGYGVGGSRYTPKVHD
jgi:membrane protein YdbS with pleckstrin-like domain